MSIGHAMKPMSEAHFAILRRHMVEAGQAEANLRQLGCSDVAIRIGDGSRGWRDTHDEFYRP